MMAAFVKALRAGDPKAALVFWRSKTWAAADRAEARRMLAAARDVALEVLA